MVSLGALVDVLAAREPAMSKADVKRVLEGFFEQATASLQQDKKVRINEFGTFTKGTRAARKARNPKTGETIEVAAASTVRFKPASALKVSM